MNSQHNFSVFGKIPLLLFFLMFLGELATAQDVRGKVTDANNTPLIGANIIVKGTTTGTVTDASGLFKLSDVPDDGILEVSYTGFASQEIALTDGNDLVIVLQEGAFLEQVMVTAQKRGENLQRTPISISVLSGSKIGERGVNTLENALRQVPGLEIQQVAQGAQIS